MSPSLSDCTMALGTITIGLVLTIVAIKLNNSDRRPPWISELDVLGTPNKTKFSGTAVVSGGSIAGIITARICADHFEDVVVVDPEFKKVLEGGTKTRVVQYTALHAYLSFLLDGLRRLWPEFDTEVEAAGGITCPADFQGHYSGVQINAPFKEYSPGPIPQTVNMRRPVFERLLQKLLLQHSSSSNIRILDGTVRRLTRSSDGKKIDAVIVRDLGGNEKTLTDIGLIVDCTGSTQAGIKWLTSAGYTLPDNLRLSYNVKMHYMTITYSVSPELLAKLPIPSKYSSSSSLYSYQPHFDRGKLGFVLARMDNETLQLLFGGWGIAPSDLPKEPNEIVAFLDNFKGHAPIPSWVYTSIGMLTEEGNPVFEPIKIPVLSNVQYDIVPDLPSNFVAIGDASMQLNPIFGQGCAKALLGGSGLNYMLASCNHERPLPSNFSVQYFRKTAPRLKSLWDGTKPIDYGFPSTKPVAGETLADGRFVRWYTEKMVSAAVNDEQVASAVWHVRHLLAPETILMSPRMLWKILTASSLFRS